ncbi:MAG TPA: M28 family peptidase [Streptosporangiales bacterium]
MASLEDALGAIWTGTELQRDFEALCDCGGRLAGSESERQARSYLSSRLDEIGGKRADLTFDYTGNFPLAARLALTAPAQRELEVLALPGSPPGDVAGTVVDLGLGAERDFAAAGDLLEGAVALVRHEYPFTTGHTHRRFKYEWAKRAGAAAFLIANDAGAGPVAGGAGTGSPDDIPAAGISRSAGETLARAAGAGQATVRLEVESERRTWPAANLVLDLPGRTGEWVVVCAHYDGHELAESAMDNATGAAAVLEIGRRLAPLAGSLRRGIRLCLFTVEEWGLTGSLRYATGLPEDERRAISAAVALDSITGHPRLCALTTGSARMERLVALVSARTAVPVDVVRPVLANSDHHSFHQAGIDAMRLIAGYGRADSLTRRLLTAADTRDLVDPAQLKAAVTTATLLVLAACDEDR